MIFQKMVWRWALAFAVFCAALSPKPGRPQSHSDALAYVTVECAVGDFLDSLGRSGLRERPEYKSLQAIKWEILDEADSAVSSVEWTGKHPNGGVVFLRVIWQGILDPRWAEKNPEQARSVDLHPVTKSRYNARLTRRGWQIRALDPSESSSEVYPYSEYHSRGFRAVDLYYFTHCSGSVSLKVIAEKTSYQALRGLTFDEWSEIDVRKSARAEFKWGSAALSRASEETRIAFLPKLAKQPHEYGVVLQRGKLFTRACFAPYETGEIYVPEIGRVRFQEAEVAVETREKDFSVTVLRGEAAVYPLKGEKPSARLTVRQAGAFDGAVFQEQAADEAGLAWAAPEHYLPPVARVDGMDCLSRLPGVTVVGMGLLLDDFDNSAMVIDGSAESGVGFLERGRNQSCTVCLGAVYPIDEIRVASGSAGREDVITTEYRVEVSRTGEFRGEQVKVFEGAFSGVRGAKPNCNKKIPLSDTRAAYVRYLITDGHGASSMLYEFEVLGRAAEGETETVWRPWLTPRLARDEPELDVKVTATGAPSSVAPEIISDGKLEGNGLELKSENGSITMDFGRPVLLDSVRVTAQVSSGKHAVDGLTYAVDISESGKFEGEEKRVGSGNIPCVSRAVSDTVRFAPLKTRYVRYRVLECKQESSLIYEMEPLRSFYLHQSGWPLKVHADLATASGDGGRTLITPGETTLGIRTVSALGPDSVADIGNIHDGKTETFAVLAGTVTAVVVELQTAADIRCVEIFASPGSDVEKTSSEFVVEGSVTGEFKGEETLICTGLVQGVRSQSFDYFNRVALREVVPARFVRLRPVSPDNQGFYLYELRLIGVPKK